MPDKPQAPSPPSKTKNGFAVTIGAVSPGQASGSDAKCSRIGRKVSDMMRFGGLGRLLTRSRDPSERSVSVAASYVRPRSHHRRWSADLCKGETSHVIIVRKTTKEPRPPQRSFSLLKAHAAPSSSLKRYSCPPMGRFSSPRQWSSSSSSSSPSSSSTTSSCSSPPPVPTSIITGHDPLGWKLHPKSSSTSPRVRANRLSLQIPLPVVFPDPKPSPTPNPQSPNPDPSRKPKPPLKPKPSRRCHSDSSAFLRSLAPPGAPVVTLEELSSVHLRPLSHKDECDDVFGDVDEKTGEPGKIPPPVPHKTSMARQVAQLIADSRRRRRPASIKTKDNIYATGTRPHQRADHGPVHATKSGLRLDASCGRERLSPRFSGREI